jgi:hypothetical protein
VFPTLSSLRHAAPVAVRKVFMNKTPAPSMSDIVRLIHAVHNLPPSSFERPTVSAPTLPSSSPQIDVLKSPPISAASSEFFQTNTSIMNTIVDSQSFARDTCAGCPGHGRAFDVKGSVGLHLKMEEDEPPP